MRRYVLHVFIRYLVFTTQKIRTCTLTLTLFLILIRYIQADQTINFTKLEKDLQFRTDRGENETLTLLNASMNSILGMSKKLKI